MAFWLAFWWWLGTTIVQALLVKPRIENARPSGIDDFQAPTATEGRVVPIIVGKVQIAGPNVVWYGDLSATAIEEKVGGFLGIGGKDIIKGYEYRIGVQMGLSRGPIDGFDRIWMGDKIIKSGETTTADMPILDLDFFGGKDSGGGIDFTLEVHLGDVNQAASTYLALHQIPTPRYVNTCYVVLNNGSGGPGLIGNTAQLRQIKFEPFWYPNSLGVTGGKERIGDDANAICFLYELLVTNTDWGLGFNASDVLVTGTAEDGALRALAEQVADEGLGFSMVIDREMQARELIQEIERHVDGAFRLDLTDGRYKLILARPVTPTVTLDTSNIKKLRNFARGNWSQTKNELRIGYADREKEYNTTYALDQDRGNLDIVGERNIATLNFPGVKNKDVANKIVARELAGLSFPVSKITAEVDRSLYKLQKGDPFKWTWPDEGITDLPMRVIRIKYGDDVKKGMVIDAVENIFLLQTTGYSAPPATGWIPPIQDAVNVLDARLWNPPRQLAPRQTSTATPLKNVVVLAARNGGLQLAYDVYTDFDGGVDNFVLSNEDIPLWTPVALLVGALDSDLGDVNPYRADTVVIDNLNDVTFGLLNTAASTSINPLDPTNILLIDDELLWFETVTDLSGSLQLNNVHRGAFGTIPVDHADNARVWFPGFGAGTIVPVSDTLALSITTIRCRLTPRTAIGQLAVASASNVPAAADFTVEFDGPYAPGDAIVNQFRFADDDWTLTPGTLRVNWKTRNRSTQDFDTLQGAVSITPSPLVGVQVKVRRVDTDAIVAQTSFASGAEFNGAAFIPQAVAGTPDELDYYITVQAIGGGLLSQLWRSVNFEVFGFGIDFGGDFGGQALSSDPNIGVVLNQGAAPNIIDPVPSVPGASRDYTIDVVGAVASQNQTINTGMHLYFTSWDVAASEFVLWNHFLNALTTDSLEDIASRIEDEAITALTDRPFNVSRSGTRVTVSVTGSNLLLRQTNLNESQDMGVAPVLQDALGSQSAVKQVGYFDYYEPCTIAGVSTQCLAPQNNAAYQNSGFIRPKFEIIGLTDDARQELADNAVNGGITEVVQSSETGLDGYSLEFDDIVDKLNAHGNSKYFTASRGIWPQSPEPLSPTPMTRTGIIIHCEEDYDLVNQSIFTNTISQPSGFTLLLTVGRPVRPVGPLPQIVSVPIVFDTAEVHTNVKLEIVLGGVVFTTTVAGPGGPTQIQTAITALTALVDAHASYTALETLTGSSSQRIIKITGPNNTVYTAFYAPTFGPRVEFREVTN